MSVRELTADLAPCCKCSSNTSTQDLWQEPASYLCPLTCSPSPHRTGRVTILDRAIYLETIESGTSNKLASSESSYGWGSMSHRFSQVMSPTP